MKQVDQKKYDLAYYNKSYGDSVLIESESRFKTNHEIIYQEILSLVNLKNTDRVVDFGCGDGNLSLLIKSRFNCNVIGIDYSGDAINICKDKLNKLGNISGIDFSNKSISTTPAYGDINYVFFCDVVEHLYDEEIVNILNKIKNWNGKKIELLVHTDNNIFIKYVRPFINILYLISGEKSLEKLKEEKREERERHVNLTNPYELRKKMQQFDFKQTLFKYSTINKKQLIENQLGGLSKIPFLTDLCYYILDFFSFLNPTFYAKYEYNKYPSDIQAIDNNGKLRKIFKYIKENRRYAWVFLILISFFIINNSFPATKITSESCADGNCQQMIKKPSLSDANPKFFQNDVFSSQVGEFYRLTFREKSNQNTAIILKATDAFDQEKTLGEFSLPKSENDSFQEIVFPTDKKYTDFLFEKKSADGAEIMISDSRITKLDIKNEAEMNKIKPTIFGKVDENTAIQEQTENNFVSKQLIESKIVLGQIFKSNTDFISGIEMDFNIVKQGDGNGGHYEFVLREANFDGGVPEISGDVLTRIKFSLAEVEQYRQPDGKIRFPIYQKVKADAYYFFGIDNSHFDSNQFNHLELIGSSNSTSYLDGTAAVRKNGETFSSIGDLYFKIFGIEWEKIDGEKILLGETLEDMGGGKTLFKYQPLQKQTAMADLDSFTGDISFDTGSKAIIGSINPDNKISDFIYKFENSAPFQNFKISAQKNKLDWENVKLSYSLDGKNWQEIPENLNVEQGKQVFDQNISEATRKNIIYLKIEPQLNDETFQDKETATYGLENLLIEAELQVKSL